MTTARTLEFELLPNEDISLSIPFVFEGEIHETGRLCRWNRRDNQIKIGLYDLYSMVLELHSMLVDHNNIVFNSTKYSYHEDVFEATGYAQLEVIAQKFSDKFILNHEEYKKTPIIDKIKQTSYAYIDRFIQYLKAEGVVFEVDWPIWKDLEKLLKTHKGNEYNHWHHMLSEKQVVINKPNIEKVLDMLKVFLDKELEIKYEP
jgi:hypothetical protein